MFAFGALALGTVLAAAAPVDVQSFWLNNTYVSESSILVGPVYFAGYNNYIYRDDITAAQAVVSANASSSSPARWVLAFPEGNTGFMSYFIPQNTSSTPLQLELDLLSLTSIEETQNQTGLAGHMTLSDDASLGVAIVSGVRALRDYVEGSGLMHEIFNYTLGAYDNTSVQLVHNWINGTYAQYLTLTGLENIEISVQPNENVTIAPSIRFMRPDASRNGTLGFKATFNFTETPTTQNQGLGYSQLFLNSTPSEASSGLKTVLSALQTSGSEQEQELSFLTYKDKFLAGGWRFLTYFGRDTSIALRLLLPTLSSDSAEAVLGAILERLNTTGAVCHEETIGEYAGFVWASSGYPEKTYEPYYSYVMVDTDFLLLPSFSHYFLATPQGSDRSQSFLERQAVLQNGTYQQLLERNVQHILGLATPFGQSGDCSDLVHIRDPLVGNWRDSGTGLGYGKVPFDVNTALVPASVRAVIDLAAAGILSSDFSQNASQLINNWENQASSCFAISLDASTAESRLDNYVSAANLSQSLLYGAGSLNSTSSSSYTSNSNSSSQGVDFYALSLKEDGSKVEVMNSDIGAPLIHANNVSESIIRAALQALKPYPRGLVTNVGAVVASAAYDSNTTNIETFNYVQYHGTVSWSWQNAQFAQGLTRQLARCGLANSTIVDYLIPSDTGRPMWCDNQALTDEMLQAQTLLWDSIAGTQDVIYTEVWSPIWDNSTQKFTIGDLGAISPSGTEGDAFQLWSYGFLSSIDPRTGKAVAAGQV